MKPKSWMVGLLVGLVLLAFVADSLTRRLSFESFHVALEQRLSLALGVEVDIAGEVHLVLLPLLKMEVTGLTVANPPGTKSPHLLEIRRLWFNLKVLPLLRQAIEVEAIEISDADLHLETNAEGELELPPGLETHERSADTPGAGHSFQVQEVGLEDIRVSYVGTDRAPYEFVIEELRLEADGYDSPIRHSGKGTHPGGRFEFTADTGKAASFFESSEPFAIDLRLRVDDVSLGDNVRAHVDGSIRDVAGFEGVALDVEVDGNEFSVVDKWVDLSLPEGPMSARFRLSDAEGTLAAENISVEVRGSDVFQLDLHGQVADIREISGIDVDADLSVRDLAEAGALFGFSLPPIGPIETKGRILGSKDRLAAEALSVQIRSTDGYQLDLRGKFADVREIQGIDVTADLSILDLAETGELFGLVLPSIGPIEMKGRIRGSKDRLTSKGDARIGETQFNGDLNASFSKGRPPRIDGVLESLHVRLVDFGLAEAVALRVEGPDDPPNFLERWWSDGEALPVESLRDFDLDIALRTQRLSGRGGFKIEDLQGDLDLEGGLLSIHDVHGNYDAGRFDATLRTDARPKHPLWSIQLEAYNVDLTRTVAQFSDETGAKDSDYIGLFDISADLTSAGSTRASMTSALDGRIVTMLRDGNLVTDYGKKFFRDYLHFAVPEFLKLRKSKKGPNVQCLIAAAPIKKGVAEMEQLFLEGEGISIAGTGSIDLGRNRFNLRLAPRVHDPGLVSVAATVDVTGPFENPKFTPLVGSMARSAGRAIFKNAFRPLTGALKAGLRIKSHEADDPCAVLTAARESNIPFDALRAKE